MNDNNLIAKIAGTALSAYILGRLIGKRKGYRKGLKEGEAQGKCMLAQAKAIQRYNAEFVEEQYEIIDEKLREINEFYED